MTAPALTPHPHGENWAKWLGHLRDKPANGLELGSLRGESAEWMLQNIFTHEDSRYWCVDTFEGSDEHKLGGIDCSENELLCRERLRRFGRRAAVFKDTSDHALRYFLREDRVDFFYIDAAHDAMNVLRDSVLGFDFVKPGGIVVWDDYEWEVMDQAVDRPKIAIDAFLGCYARRLELLDVGWQVAVRKLE